MSPKITNRNIGAEDGPATRRIQRRETDKAWASCGGEEAQAPRKDLRGGLQEGRRQGSGEIARGGLAEKKKGRERRRSMAAHRDRQSARMWQEGM